MVYNIRMNSVILGASGYAGAELLRILALHPELEVVASGASSHAGVPISQLYPSLYPHFKDKVFDDVDSIVTDIESGALSVDVIFLSLPNGISRLYVPRIIEKVGLVVDLSADFRLKDPKDYIDWYNGEHGEPNLLEMAVYGLPEITRTKLKEAKLIAAAGCYVTCATLALHPLVEEGLIERSGIIIDAASGVSGAGRSLKDNYLFSEVDENFSVYGLKNHRHTPEIEQNLGAQVLFTPHLLPANRGILATSYSRPSSKFKELISGGVDQDSLGTNLVQEALSNTYQNESFVYSVGSPPPLKATLGSNNALVFATYDLRTDTIITISALDNLVKGAAGQAVQCANLALGFDETCGLQAIGLYP